MFSRLLTRISTKVCKDKIPNPKASCSHFIPPDIIRQFFPMLFFIHSIGMSRQRSSNLQNQHMIKILMLRIPHIFRTSFVKTQLILKLKDFKICFNTLIDFFFTETVSCKTYNHFHNILKLFDG